MFVNVDLTPEEEEITMRKLAEGIHNRKMDSLAIILLESFKPLSFMGAQMSRFLIQPYLFAFGEEIGVSSEKYLQIFEKRENVEKLLNFIDELNEKDKKMKGEHNKEKKILKNSY